MAFCPLDYRYGDEDFKRIWSEVGRHERQLEVERALIWAHWQLGRVTEDDYNAVAAIANPESVSKERVSEIEAETRHDIMALTKAMAEAAGEAGWCIHLGATSNDIVDTAVALQLRDSIVLLRKKLCELILVCADVAERERDTVMLGRTHGQAAVPITFGLKAAVWLDEMRRQLIRLDEAAPRVAVGKFLGAVGTGAAQGEHARELQRLIMTHLGLGVPLATTQVVGRDRYVEYMSWLANVATTCEKVLQEIRNLQRSEIAEKDSMSKNKWARRPWRTKRTPSNPKTHPAWHASFVRLSSRPMRTPFCGMSATLQTPAANALRSRTPQPLPRT